MHTPLNRLQLRRDTPITQEALETFLVKAGNGRIKGKTVKIDGKSVFVVYSKTSPKGNAVARFFSYFDRRDRRAVCATALAAAFKQANCRSLGLEAYLRHGTAPHHDLGARELLQTLSYRRVQPDAVFHTGYSPGERACSIGKVLYRWGEKAIGEGSYGKVFRAEGEVHGRDGAVTKVKDLAEGPERQAMQATKVIKLVQASDAARLAEAQSEARMHKRITGHPNIIGYDDGALSTDANGQHVYCHVMEDAPHGKASSLAKAPLAPEARWCVLADVTRGLAWMHQHHVRHNDLKPDNVLIGEGGVAKICDFGTATDQDMVLEPEAVSDNFLYLSPREMRLRERRDGPIRDAGRARSQFKSVRTELLTLEAAFPEAKAAQAGYWEALTEADRAWSEQDKARKQSEQSPSPEAAAALKVANDRVAAAHALVVGAIAAACAAVGQKAKSDDGFRGTVIATYKSAAPELALNPLGTADVERAYRGMLQQLYQRYEERHTLDRTVDDMVQVPAAEKTIGTQKDIWDLGITAFELFYGKSPVDGGDPEPGNLQQVQDKQRALLLDLGQALDRGEPFSAWILHTQGIDIQDPALKQFLDASLNTLNPMSAEALAQLIPAMDAEAVSRARQALTTQPAGQ